MPRLLDHPLAREHAREILQMEADEIRRLRVIYERARREMLGRLLELDGDSFSAQRVRVALVQVEAALRGMLEQTKVRREAALRRELKASTRQITQQIAHYAPQFRGAQTRIQTEALRSLANPEKLLLRRFETSMRTYGGQLVGEMQGRLAVHAARKSTMREMALDLAGKTHLSAMQGARWRAERIVRTETMNALSEGHQATLQAGAKVVPGLQQQWDATLDRRTSKVCIQWNGRVRDLGEAFGTIRGRKILKPPALPNCRSRVVPYHPDWAADDEEAERTTPVGRKPPRAPERRAETKKARQARTSAADRQRAALKAAEASIGDETKFETAVMINSEGREILRKKGQARSVSFYPYELREARGAIFTHNHPSGTSLSPPDVRLAAMYRLGEMRAVGAVPVWGPGGPKRWVYSIRPERSGGWGPESWIRIEKSLKDAHRDVLARSRRKMAAGEITEAQANGQHWHEVWTIVARETGLVYSRTGYP